MVETTVEIHLEKPFSGFILKHLINHVHAIFPVDKIKQNTPQLKHKSVSVIWSCSEKIQFKKKPLKNSCVEDHLCMFGCDILRQSQHFMVNHFNEAVYCIKNVRKFSTTF